MKMQYRAEIARAVAEELVRLLQPNCLWVEIVGSLRRKKETVGDIELLCVPKYMESSAELWPQLVDCLDEEIKKWIRLDVLDFRRGMRGQIIYGRKNKLLVHVPSGIPVDIFSTDAGCWPVALVVRTGPKESNMRIAREAMKKGWRFHAYGRGFTRGEGITIPCHSERAVFEKVGLEYLPPERR